MRAQPETLWDDLQEDARVSRDVTPYTRLLQDPIGPVVSLAIFDPVNAFLDDMASLQTSYRIIYESLSVDSAPVRLKPCMQGSLSDKSVAYRPAFDKYILMSKLLSASIFLSLLMPKRSCSMKDDHLRHPNFLCVHLYLYRCPIPVAVANVI